jgi:hypothetical protein
MIAMRLPRGRCLQGKIYLYYNQYLTVKAPLALPVGSGTSSPGRLPQKEKALTAKSQTGE